MQEWLVSRGSLEPQGDRTTSGAIDTSVAIYANMVIGSVQGNRVANFPAFQCPMVEFSTEPMLEKAEESEASTPVASSNFHQALRALWLVTASSATEVSSTEYKTARLEEALAFKSTV